MVEPISGSAGKQQLAGQAITQPMAKVVGACPLPGLALPEIGPAEQFLVDLYDRTYGRLPTKGARKLAWALVAATQASEGGDTRAASEALRHAAALQAVLDKHKRCRRCGRELRNDVSVARGIGPECWGKEQ